MPARLKKTLTRLSILMILFFNSQYIKSQTTIVNQTFSSSIPSGWSADLSSWSLNYNYSTNDHTPNDYCASIADGKPSKFIYIPVTMLAGAKYNLSFWTKRIGGITVYINSTTNQVAPLYTYTVTQTLDNNWKQTTCNSYIALTSGQFYFQIAYTGSTYGNGAGYLDDVKVIETSSGNQNSWSITGSSGTNMVSNFIGTTDAQGLVFKTNNIERAQFDMTGNFVLNTGGIFKNDLKLEKGFTFDGSNGIRYVPNGNGGGIFKYGNNNSALPMVSSCATPGDPLTGGIPQNIHQIGGVIQLFDDSGPTGSYNPGGSVLNFQSWTTCSSIDATGGQPNGGLLINYFCGKDVNICTGSQGGRVGLGKMVNIGGAWPINPNTALDIRANGTKGLAVQNNLAVEVFSVSNDGKTKIGQSATTSSARLEVNGQESSMLIFGNSSGDIQSTSSFRPHFATNKDYTIFEGVVGSGEAKYSIVNDKHTFYINATRPANNDAFELWDTYNNKAFFKVKTNGFVYAREVTVTLANAFPDYVFAKDYKLMPLADVKIFTDKHHHLPNMPTANSIEKDGANLGEIQRITVEKVEELYRYIFEMESEIKELKKQIGDLKTK